MKHHSKIFLVISLLLCTAACEETDIPITTECTSGAEYKCENNTLTRCDNGEWTAIVECPDHTQCNATTGKCETTAAQCTNGEWKCDSNKLSKCQNGEWESIEICPEDTQCDAETGSCQKTGSPKTECLDTEHLFANKCETDDVTHCGSHTNDCTKLSGWKNGLCIDKTCFAEDCKTGYHLAGHMDSNNNEITSCEEDTHDACGSVNTKCGDSEVCTNGECQENCKSGEVICGGSCINPMTSNNFCGADAACSSYLACSDFEACINGQCVLSSCKNAEESLCMENGQKVCVNIHGNNLNHCGACDAVCPEKATAKTSCQNGQCKYTCNTGMTNCGSDTEPLCLSQEQFKSDPQHCGNCDKKCASNEFCQDGKCIVSSCTSNECFFNNACVNQNDHCGAQCLNCNTANLASAGICQGGSCTITSCIAGYHLTNQGVCEIDSATACPNGNANGTVNCNTIDVYTKAGICAEGKCQATTCQSNAHLKNGKCIADSVNACGSSETNCSTNSGWSDGYCSEGKCIAKKCQSGYCVNSLTNQCTNEQSISACGTDGGYCQSCNQTQICSAGKCGTKQCDGNVCNQSNNPQTMSCKNDNTHCGSGCQNCNTFTSHATSGICLADGTCQVTACETNYHVYNNACEEDSTTNCGAHGTQCNVANANNKCQNKACTFTCNDGFEQSNNTCISDKFISVWNVNNISSDFTFIIGERVGTIIIDWGDGQSDTISNSNGAVSAAKHKYSAVGQYTITVTGKIDGWFGRDSLVSIQSYGKFTFRDHAFASSELVSLPTNEAPKFINNDMSYAFFRASKFNQDISFWDTSKVTNMHSMFYKATSFNQPLNNWDTSNVTVMNSMFYEATSFNQPLNNWDTSNVTDMNSMFSGATSFNQPLNNWDTSNVTGMNRMFSGATSFNQPLNNWDTSNVTGMSGIFKGATSFNQPLNNWDTSNITRMDSMFTNATSFNQPLNNWDTSNITSMSGMFKGATSFNQPLNNWDTSNVTNMTFMFDGATSFNQPLNNWDTSNVTNMSKMFMNATSFNQPLNNWNTSKVYNISSMFYGATKFNQDISNWDVSVLGKSDSSNYQKVFCKSALNSYMSKIRQAWMSKNSNLPSSIFTTNCE